ncbi:MAG: hypothetical protein HY801_14710 [Candidatus Lindowbacteria bacterium]|nr:hypothetical protein [Candidatus Lindowbacteria bacterium]
MKDIAERHPLSTSQRGIMLARLANMKQGARTDLGPIGPKSISNQDAADMANVGLNTIKRSKKVIDNGTPELAKAVDNGDGARDVAERL